MRFVLLKFNLLVQLGAEGEWLTELSPIQNGWWCDVSDTVCETQVSCSIIWQESWLCAWVPVDHAAVFHTPDQWHYVLVKLPVHSTELLMYLSVFCVSSLAVFSSLLCNRRLMSKFLITITSKNRI